MTERNFPQAMAPRLLPGRHFLLSRSVEMEVSLMGRFIWSIYSRIHETFTGDSNRRCNVVTVRLSNGREFELPEIEERTPHEGGDIRAVIPCKSIVLAVGADKMLRMPVRCLGINSHGDLQLMDISCDSITYPCHSTGRTEKQFGLEGIFSRLFELLSELFPLRLGCRADVLLPTVRASVRNSYPAEQKVAGITNKNHFDHRYDIVAEKDGLRNRGRSYQRK